MPKPMNLPPDRETAIFNAARRLPVEERAFYLEGACAGDAGLRQRVEELLRAGEAAGGFLKELATEAHGRDEAARLYPAAATPVTPSPSERPGDRIGRYKLLQQIGEGGCGVVYMAEQEEPVRRRVALKVIKLGMDTRQVIARFGAERQALALMDHPNIAKVLDAGATDTGRPYFVMELVHGIKITDYCDRNRLSTRERLDLFVQVCQAIQHAHQKGIIHRDIKPSNILVTLRDGVPVPKVIDFGIAKATTEQRLTDKTVFTAFEQFIGTPAYMSPEQAEMSELGIDTRSDIYSLGVLLYELLTGKTPFEVKRLLEAGLDEVRRIILEEEPVRPSTRLNTLDAAEQTTLAEHRQSEPPKLVHLIRGDLDWIVMKALEKDRARRYETANGLAMDVQRHLNSEPVVARPQGQFYRLGKLVRRNKLAFAAASAVASALLAGTIVSTWQYVQKSKAEQEQRRLRETAQRAQAATQIEANRSSQVAHYLKNMLEDIAPSLAKGCTIKYVRGVLTQVDEHVANDLKEQPDLEAVVRTTLAEVQGDIGEYATAEANLRKVLAMRRRLYGYTHPDVAASLGKLVDLLRMQGKGPEAEGLAKEAIGVLEHLVQRNPKREEYRQDLGQSQLRLGDLLAETDRRQGAAEVVRQALQTFENAARDFPGNAHFREEEAFSHRKLGDLLQGLGRVEETERHYRTAIKFYTALKAEAPGNELYYGEEARTTWTLATTLERAGRLDEAAGEYRRSLTLHEQAIARFPGQADFKSRRDSVRSRLVSLLDSQDNQTGAEAILREQSQESLVRRLPGQPETDAARHGSPGKLIPLIVMQDVPLTDAIKNLARQANLNFTFDPSVTNEIPGADGRIVAQAIVNIRWENVTAQGALATLLANHGLVIVEDPLTQIACITVGDSMARTEKGLAAIELVGKPVPRSFKLPLLNGGEIELPSTTNHGPLLLDFCASWCGPCRQAIPVVADIAKDYSALGLSYVLVDQGEAPETIRRYLAKARLDIPVALDKPATSGSSSWCLMAQAFRIEGIPTIVLVDPSNTIRYVQMPPTPDLGHELRRALDEVLKP